MALALNLRKWNGKVFGDQLFSSKTCFEAEPIGSMSMLKIVFKRFANSLLQTEAVFCDKLQFFIRGIDYELCQNLWEYPKARQRFKK